MAYDIYTKLLLHCNGTDASTTFTDEIGNTVTANGSAQIDTAQSKFGGASGLFAGGSDRLSIPDSADWDFGSGDFTIDFWVRFNNLGGNQALVSQWGGGGSDGSFYVVKESDGTFAFYYSTGGEIRLPSTYNSFVTNTWYHLEVCRDGTTIRFFVDGVAKGTGSIGTTTIQNSTRPLNISTYADGAGQAINGWIDEVRISKGIARHTSDFTPETAEYPEEVTTVDVTDTLSVIDSISVDERTQELSDTLSVTDSLTVIEPFFNGSETVSVIDGLSVDERTKEISETLSVTDSLLVNNIHPVFSATRILSINPLLFVTNTDPVIITKVDTTDPDNLLWETSSIDELSYAVDASIDDLKEFIYITGENGLICKVEIADLENQEIIDTEDSDALLHIESFDEQGLVFSSTESTTGELYLIDNRETKILDSNLQVLYTKQYPFDSSFNCVEGKILEANLQVLSMNRSIIGCDFKCLTNTSQITPIKRPDFVVKVDGVDLESTDLILDSISITHSVDNKSSATFTLTRKHDRLNYTLSNNLVEITNQNEVEIYIDGHLEFPKEGQGTGRISNLDCQYTNVDQVVVTAEASVPEYKYNSVCLSLPSLDKQLSLYDVLVQNPKIYNPYIDVDEENPRKYKGIKVSLGEQVEQSVTRFLEYDSFGSVATGIQDGTFKPKQLRTYFWSPSVRKFGTPKANNSIPEANASVDNPFHSITLPVFTLPSIDFLPFEDPISGNTSLIHFAYIGTSLAPISEDLWILSNAKHRWQRIFDDKVTLLGDGQITIAQLEKELPNGLDASAIYSMLQSQGYIDGSGNITTSFKQIADPQDLELVNYNTHKEEIHSILVDKLGYYLGSAPYKSVSSRNGILLPSEKWVDEDNGLYSIKEASYNFVEYAKRVAELEYKKISNINGDILPETSCSLTTTIDAYYYFDLRLLNRVNVDNTTQAGIYKNNNGFPVSIKSVTISSQSMNVSIQADNQKSSVELEEIDGQYPDENSPEYNEPEKRTLVALKSDMNSRLLVE